ncbi:MAG TPA: RIP metalloprotease RseP [Oscillospiraceae bacterium]|nr:RIP metalloprotease RseP [Oscillospiraceae bacterium]HPF56366.1 RIP metalloprotease RseP [Clostridiales bacterium]HPK34285.1 RIP metalloprotease RseP [Oscillospiraceae bacterium]HPR74812.1 RIP metalloprotease RseP [Oscillospiraceae bacterium]
MNIVWQIIIALLVLDLLIVIHELGHYIAARLFKIKVQEFAIGMGPKILKIQGKHNLFSLRAFPIGGMVAMEGEDEDSTDPDAFCNKKAWKRFIVIIAGAVMNLILGLILTSILVLGEKALPSRTVDQFFDNAVSVTSGLRAGDELLNIDGTHISIYSDAVYAIMRNQTGNATVTVRRNGEKITLENVRFETEVVGKTTVSVRDFYFTVESKNFENVVRHSFYGTISLVKVVYQSIYDIARGKYSASEVSGPVGTVEVIGEAASQGLDSLIYLAAFITVNLGVFNLLPLPALDGGRLIFIIIEMIRRKPVPKKYESMIHFIGFMLLILLIILVTFNDIKSLITRNAFILYGNMRI